MRGLLAALSFLFVLQGCQPGSVPVAVESGQYLEADKNRSMLITQLPFSDCPPVESAMLRLAESPDEWRELHARKGVIGDHVSAPAASDGMDFETHIGLLVMLGSRPTPGYALSLATSHVIMEADDIARVTFRVSRPEPGAIMGQVITYPCALIQLPRSGYRSIRVYFENDETGMMEITVP